MSHFITQVIVGSTVVWVSRQEGGIWGNYACIHSLNELEILNRRVVPAILVTSTLEQVPEKQLHQRSSSIVTHFAATQVPGKEHPMIGHYISFCTSSRIEDS